MTISYLAVVLIALLRAQPSATTATVSIAAANPRETSINLLIWPDCASVASGAPASSKIPFDPRVQPSIQIMTLPSVLRAVGTHGASNFVAVEEGDSGPITLIVEDFRSIPIRLAEQPDDEEAMLRVSTREPLPCIEYRTLTSDFVLDKGETDIVIPNSVDRVQIENVGQSHPITILTADLDRSLEERLVVRRSNKQLSGNVVNWRGQPAVRALVSVTRVDPVNEIAPGWIWNHLGPDERDAPEAAPAGSVAVSITTDKSGLFDISLPYHGKYQLVVLADEALPEVMQVDIPRDSDLDISLKGSLPIRGTVVWSDDFQPVAGAYVNALPCNPEDRTRERLLSGFIRTDDRGSFVIPALDPRIEYDVHVRYEGVLLGQQKKGTRTAHLPCIQPGLNTVSLALER